MSVAALDHIVAGTSQSPHAVLGPHPYGGHVTVRTLQPNASTVSVDVGGRSVAMRHEYEGIWVAVLPQDKVPDYRIEVAYADGTRSRIDDPYR